LFALAAASAWACAACSAASRSGLSLALLFGLSFDGLSFLRLSGGGPLYLARLPDLFAVCFFELCEGAVKDGLGLLAIYSADWLAFDAIESVSRATGRDGRQIFTVIGFSCM
jgi:hypothetical protein